MRIEPADFDSGVVFNIKATTELERILLYACVNQNKPTATLRCGSEANEFLLTAPVCNS